MSHTEIVQLDEILSAREQIASKIHRTPMSQSTFLSEKTQTQLYLKLELFQKTGSFKVRGITNKISTLSAEEKKNGVISLSAGNAAQAVAWAASQYGIPSTLIMPQNSVLSKQEATRGYGGKVILTDENLLEFCFKVQKEHNLCLVHPFDDLKVIAGHGSLGLEIIEDVPNADVVVVGVGGGGLISGVATAIKAKSPTTKVIGVEPEGAPTMTQSLAKGEAIHLDSVNTIADGLAAPFAGKHTFAHVQHFVDEIVLVSEDEILGALKLIWERCKVLAEPAACASVAAVLNQKIEIPEGATVVCLISGGNVDINNLHKLL